MKEDVKIEETLSPLYGQPWKNEFITPSFDQADEKRNNILKSGKVQVKVKRRSDGTFVVKTRNLKTSQSATKKSKSSKSKNKNKEQ